MAEADIASLDDSQGNDCSLVAYLLKSKGLHKLYYVFGLGLESFINVWLLLNFSRGWGIWSPSKQNYNKQTNLCTENKDL